MTELAVAPDPIVFVVDDQANVRTSLDRLLRANGFRVKPFASAQEFLAAADERDAGCVILDYQMPGLNGLELQEVLATRGSPWQIIFLTGRGDIPKTVQAMLGGAVDFLVKPASQEDLLGAVRRALGRDRARRAQRAEVAEVCARLQQLSPRERQVFGHVIAGRLNKQIAEIFGTAEKTVKIQRAAVMQKMGVRSVAELVRCAEKAGIAPS